MLLINQAFAAEAATETASSSTMSFLPLILIFAIFYLLVIRPQQKKAKEHQLAIKKLKAGAKIVTVGGIAGVIKEIKENEKFAKVEIADGVVIEIIKSNIAEALDKKEISNKKDFKKKKGKK